MYLIQILAIAIWLFVSVSALFHFKKTILIWMMARLLLNAQIAVKYNSPGMSTVIAIDMTLILIYFFKYRTKKRKEGLRFEKFPLTAAFWITLASFLLSSMFAIVPLSSGLVATLKYFVSNFGIIFVFFKCLNTEEDIKLYVKTGFIVAIVISCLGLFESIFKDNPWLDFVYLYSPHDEETRGRLWYIPPFVGGGLQMRLGMVRAYSTFGIHIAFGAACVFLLFLFMSITRYRFYPSVSNKKLYTVILLLLAGALASNSKTPLVGLVVLVFAFYGLGQIFQPKIILPLVVVIVAVFVFFPNIIANLMTLFNPEMADEAGGSTVEMRHSQFDVAFRLFNMSPLFGNGMGSLHVMRDFGNNAEILGAESSMLTILPERGLIGVVAYVSLYLSLFKYGIKFLPNKLAFFYLLSLAVMEFATGFLDQAIWINVYLCVIRLFQIRRIESLKTVASHV